MTAAVISRMGGQRIDEVDGEVGVALEDGEEDVAGGERPRRCPLLRHRRLARASSVGSEDALRQPRTAKIYPR